MSITTIHTDITTQKILKDIIIKFLPSPFAYNFNYIHPYVISQNKITIPFAYAVASGLNPRPLTEYKKVSYDFKGELRDEQKKVKSEAINTLNQNKSVIISAYTGFGKSITSLYIAKKIGLKTMIICHRLILINQWVDSIRKYCPDAKIQELTTSSHKEDADFYIMNAINVAKKDREFYEDIGLVIVDECHLIMSEVLSNSMLKINPRYVIGLSATPYREDGLDKLIELYFGKNKIERKLEKKYIIYKINTKFVPEVVLQNNGKINWGVVINSQAMDENRNNMIIDIVRKFKDRVFLVVCKRVDQAKYIYDKLIEHKEKATSLIGKQQNFDRNARVLVGINSKTGTGFDFDRLDALILATDIEAYAQQVIGRVLRRPDVEPIVFDIVDKNPILKKHFNTRKNIYLDNGGIIKNFATEFPDINIC